MSQDQVTEALMGKLDLLENQIPSSILILDILKKHVVYSSNVENPQAQATQALKVWEGATALQSPDSPKLNLIKISGHPSLTLISGKYRIKNLKVRAM